VVVPTIIPATQEVESLRPGRAKLATLPPPPPGFGELAGLVEYLGEATNKTRICVCMYVRDWINTKGEDGGYLSGRAFA
jgi:hypothetical protein